MAVSKHPAFYYNFTFCGMKIPGFDTRYFFFSGKGPRSRRYGRIAAMRLIVQPCDEDEDEDDDDYFLSFS
jgi:hypothetical protein